MKSSRADCQRIFMRVLAAGLLLAFGVIAVNCDTIIPRNGWSKRWGPMVPHSTFPGDCSICHVPERWDALREDFAFDHEKETGHPLDGAHAEAVCLRCHNDRGPVQVYAARGCAGCHPDPHKSTLGMDCTRCHNQANWGPSGLVADHARTRFPLVGTHTVTPCESCHLQASVGDFRGAPTTCSLCHRNDLARATSPDHVSSGWTRGCERCHTPLGWDRAHFSHDFFPLTFGHAGLDCSRCHPNGVFSPISTECYSCHRDDYQGAPGHVPLNYSRDCTLCHSTVTWHGAVIDHGFFPLTGGHAGLQCTRCHVSGTFGPIPSECSSCHQDDYQRAPGHASKQYPTDCAGCHGTAAWRPADFNHRFPLRGPHDRSCTTCHQSGDTSAFTCLACHEHERTRMDDKHRQVSGYTYDSQACYRCHPNGTH